MGELVTGNITKARKGGARTTLLRRAAAASIDEGGPGTSVAEGARNAGEAKQAAIVANGGSLSDIPVLRSVAREAARRTTQ